MIAFLKRLAEDLERADSTSFAEFGGALEGDERVLGELSDNLKRLLVVRENCRRALLLHNDALRRKIEKEKKEPYYTDPRRQMQEGVLLDAMAEKICLLESELLAVNGIFQHCLREEILGAALKQWLPIRRGFQVVWSEIAEQKVMHETAARMGMKLPPGMSKAH